MIIYFLRHASAGEPFVNPKKDEKRALDKEGIEQCGYVGRALAAIEAQVDVTLVELSELLRERHGASFAPSTIWRFLDHHGMTFKKNSTRQRAGAAGRRRPQAGLVRRPAGSQPRPSGLHR